MPPLGWKNVLAATLRPNPSTRRRSLVCPTKGELRGQRLVHFSGVVTSKLKDPNAPVTSTTDANSTTVSFAVPHRGTAKTSELGKRPSGPKCLLRKNAQDDARSPVSCAITAVPFSRSMPLYLAELNTMPESCQSLC